MFLRAAALSLPSLIGLVGCARRGVGPVPARSADVGAAADAAAAAGCRRSTTICRPTIRRPAIAVRRRPEPMASRSAPTNRKRCRRLACARLSAGTRAGHRS